MGHILYEHTFFRNSTSIIMAVTRDDTFLRIIYFSIAPENRYLDGAAIRFDTREELSNWITDNNYEKIPLYETTLEKEEIGCFIENKGE